MRSNVLVVVAAAAAFSACIPLFGNSEVTDQPDGEACGGSAECASGMCDGNLCDGGGCDPSKGCGNAKFACLYDSGIILGIGAGYYCAMECGFSSTGSDGCPAGYECDGQYCDYIGPQLSVAYAPATPQAGEPIVFTASATLDAAVTDYAWTFTDYYGDAILGSGSDAAMTESFPAGSYNYSLTADVAGTSQNAYGTVAVCALGGQDCAGATCCTGYTCQSGSDGYYCE